MEKPTISQTSVQLLGTTLDVVLGAHGLPPLFGIGFGVVVLTDSILARFFLDKSKRWFTDYDRITKQEVDNLMQKIESRKEEFWANVIHTIDKLDSSDKAEYGGNLLKALIKEKINIRQYQRLVSVVQSIHINDLNAFRLNNWSHSTGLGSPSFEYDTTLELQQENMIFTNNGLLLESIVTKANEHKIVSSPYKKAIREYKVSPFGQLLIDYGFKDCSRESSDQ